MTNFLKVFAVLLFTLPLTLLHPISVLADSYELPSIGDSSGRVISPEQERELGERLMRRLRQDLQLLQDPLIQDYIDNLGYRLVSHSDDRSDSFTFFVVNSNQINAFAAPGGFIGLNAGLIRTTQSESELAAVIAHEIAHITQRHMARAYEAAGKHQMAAAIAILAAMLVGGQNDQLAQAAVASGVAASAQLQLNFTRANEREADRVGMQILEDSGFDPTSMATFFERMKRATRLYGSEPPEFLSTHPVSSSRIADAKGRAAQYPKHPTKEDPNYYIARARLQVLTSDDDSRTEKEFARNLASGKYEREDAERYGYALALMKNRHYDEARKQVQRLLKSDPQRIAYLLAQARIEVESGNTGQGLDDFAQALRNYPYNRPLTYFYADALLRAGKAERARKLLQDYLRNRQADAEIHKLYARAAGDAGHVGEAYQHMAEYYFLNGQTRAAIEQLTQASKLDDLDFYESSQIEARLKQLKQIALQEEQK